MVHELDIAFIRHGQDTFRAEGRFNGMSGGPLTELGKQQARSVGEKLRGTNGIVYVSPLERARQTGEIIAEIAGIELVREISDLRERNLGEMNGLREPKDLWPRGPYATILHGDTFNQIGISSLGSSQYILTDPFIYGQESWIGVYSRAVKALDQIADEHNPEKKAIIVAHGGIGKMLVASCDQPVTYGKFVKALRIYIPNAEIYPLTYRRTA